MACTSRWRIGGWADAARAETRWALEIPYGLSLLAFHDARAEVKGLDIAPRKDWPPVPIVPLAFDTPVNRPLVIILLRWRRMLQAAGRNVGDRVPGVVDADEEKEQQARCDHKEP